MRILGCRAMTTFDDDSVTAFLHGLHGRRPFPWQLALARAAQAGSWPAAVDAPTGLGKTWSIDIAVLAMAAAGLRGERDVFRRVFFVVDRRTVVDEAYEHANELARALHDAVPGSLQSRVAEGLNRLKDGAASGAPLTVTRMRGGVTWDDRWVDRPDQPSVVVSTVDQIGSRLLFRGYGVSDRTRSIDAAMTGTFSLVFLDEAHLSRPFAALLDLVRGAQGSCGGGLQVVSLSATQRNATGVLKFDIEAHMQDEVARQRLLSDKRLAILRSSPSARSKTIASLVETVVAAEEARRVLVVCNTVAGARTVHSRLRTMTDKVGLLTGRGRPVDRDLVADQWLPQFRETDDASANGSGAVVLVATQTVEVGVNIDADFLVTEECAVDALVQRLGRLNRFGTRAGTAVVVTTGLSDPVYGEAAPNTSAMLTEWGAGELGSAMAIHAEHGHWLDVSPLSLRAMVSALPPDRLAGGVEGAALTRPATSSPLLDRGLLDGWARTAPVPLPDVPVEPYLHGLTDMDTTVLVAWRADVPEKDDEALVLPVVSAECVELPLSAVRAWLVHGPAPDLADIDGTSSGGDDEAVVDWVRRVTEGTRVETLRLRRVRPGDTLLFPTSAGGLDQWGWAPESTSPVLDVGDIVRRRDAHLIRLSGATLRPLVQGPGSVWGEHATVEDSTWLEAAQAIREVRSVLDSDDQETLADALLRLKAALLRAWTAAGDPRFHRLLVRLEAARPSAGAVSLVRLAAVGHDMDGSVATADLSAAEDVTARGSSIIGQKVTLSRHSRAVADRARQYATNLGLDDRLAEVVARAGEWHDLGKRDRRFQAMLWGGIVPFGGSELLAKSGLRIGSPLARRAWQLSRYPSGMRHEALSAALVQALLNERPEIDSLDEVDGDLLVHLVASHHGRGRPLAATVDDPDPKPVHWEAFGTSVTVSSSVDEDLSWARRFDELNARYGHWCLALLESLVRLADISCSREGS